MIDRCIYCDTEMPDWDPKMCCSGYMCGCMGMPTEPQVCSRECYLLAYPHTAYDEQDKKDLEQLKLIPKDQMQEYLKQKYNETN